MKITKVIVGPALKDILALCYKAKTTPVLVGKTGVGKSEMVAEFAMDSGIECRVLDLTIMEPVDLIGLPEKNGTTVRYLPPETLPQTGKGILFLDEINRATRQMLNGSLQLLSARRLNAYLLPPEWMIAAAINPDDDDNYDTNRLDDAMMARFIKIEVEPSVSSWIQYAEKSGHHAAVIAFVKSMPKIFDARMSNPRAWTKISKLVYAWEQSRQSMDPLQAVIQGSVGNELAVAFISTLRNPAAVKGPSPENIVNDYKRVRGVIRGYGKAGDTARLESVCQQMFLHLQDPVVENAIKRSKQNLSNLAQFRSDLMAEFRVKLDSHAPWIEKEADSNGGH